MMLSMIERLRTLVTVRFMALGMLCTACFAFPRESVAFFQAEKQVESHSWKRHAIDASLKGADGVRLGDFNHDGLRDVVTGWEESGVVRLYLNPGPDKIKDPWPAVTIGKGNSPEDAVPFDIDGDGTLEVISCHEGKQKQVIVHQFTGPDRTTSSLLKSANWSSFPVSKLDGQMWMFATPITLNDRKRGLVIGSKGNNASITLLAPSSQDEKDIQKWQVKKLRQCGWIMSIQNIDMDQDGDTDIVFSDRKSNHRAVAWLEQPDDPSSKSTWTEHTVGSTNVEPLFIDASPQRILVSTRNNAWFNFRRLDAEAWRSERHENPNDVSLGKAIRSLSDNTIVMTANTKADKSKSDQPGIWLKQGDQPWIPIGTKRECKFDRMELIDLDADGDLDVMTCEERQQLGVIWYENPGIK